MPYSPSLSNLTPQLLFLSLSTGILRIHLLMKLPVLDLKKNYSKKGFQTSTFRQGKNFSQTLFGTICNTSIKDIKTIDQLSEHFILLWPLTY